MRKIKLDKRYVRFISAFFLLGFVVGVMIVNVFGRGYTDQAGIISDYYIRQYKYVDIDPSELFLYLCKHRIKWILIIWTIGFTAINIPSVLGYVTWFGFTAGILISLSILKLGAYGILFFIAAMLPQAIIYIPCWIFFLQCVYKKGNEKQRIGRVGLWKNWDLAYLLILVGNLMVFLLGILTESYINPWFIKQILKIF